MKQDIKNINYYYSIFPKKFIDDIKATREKGTIMTLHKIDYDGSIQFKAIV